MTPAVEPAFAGGGLGFAGVPIAKDSSLLEAGFDLCVSPSAMLGLNYLGEFAMAPRRPISVMAFSSESLPLT